MIILILENAINFSSIKEAKEMILEGRLLTKRTGVPTLSKFQLFSETEVVNKEHLEYCMKRALTFEDAKTLFEYGASIGQDVFFTCMAPKFIRWLDLIGCKFIKIRYYDRYNKELCSRALDWLDFKSEKIMFLSSDEEYEWGDNVNILECVPKYPASMNDYTLEYKYDGISDHTPNLRMFRKYRDEYEYWERHVCLNGAKATCLEREWVSTFSEIEEVLK